MQWDRTRIVICERGYPEILDLALHVIRAFSGPLAWSAAAGILPMAALNAWLLAGWSRVELEPGVPAVYLVAMTGLVWFEAPVATACMTLVLGAAVFGERRTVRQVAARFLQALPQLLWYQVLCRFWYFRRTYFGEVILLEGNPFWARGRAEQSSRRRAAVLHQGLLVDLAARTLVAHLVGAVLVAAIWLSVYYVSAVLMNDWKWDPAMFTVAFPTVLWIVAAYLAVVRFLSYLDLRIRREGWEVELQMRAEAARLMRSWP